MTTRLRVLAACVLVAAATPPAWSNGGGSMPMPQIRAPREESPEDKAKTAYNKGVHDVKKADKFQASSAQLTDAGKKERAVREAQEKVAAQVQLPAGSRIEWVGEFGNLQDAIRRLSIVVPISLALIAMLIWFNFGSVVDTVLTMSVIPMAVFGGILGLLLTGIPFSVSAAIGFIALFGISVMDGIIILSQYNQLIDEGMERGRAILRTGELQLRPVLMTCVVAGIGLLPAALSSGIGSQVQKPLAVVVVAGMMLAPVVILVTLPALISMFSRRSRAGLAAEGHMAPAE